MIEEQAVIKSISAGFLTVEIANQSSCSSCSEKASCGTSSLSQLFGKRPSIFKLKIDGHERYKVGDSIKIGLEEQQFVRASLLIYILPLMMMIGFAVIAENLFQNELIVLFFALVGLMSGFFWSSKTAKQSPQIIQPKIIKSS